MSRSLLFFIFSVLSLRGLLEISYVSVISPYFGYFGFKINFSYINYLLSWLFFLGGSFFLKANINRVSDFFFNAMTLAILLPLCILFGYDAERSFVPIITSFGSLSIIYFLVNTKSISFRSLAIFRGGLTLVILISILFVLFLINWFLYSGVNLNFNIMEVYDFRSENRGIAGGGILNYTNGWTYNVFNITLFSIALLFRRYAIAFIIFLVQVYFFSATSFRSVLFIPFIVLSLFIYFRNTNRATFIPVLLSLLVAFALSTYYFFGDTIVSSILVRRIFFIPSHLNFIYFEFFNENPKVMWSNNLLSTFINYPYDEGLSVAKVVGGYLGYPDMNANNGYISSGYAHAGFFGVFFYSLILGVILRFLDQITHNLTPLWFALSLCVIPLAALMISSDLFTVLLTHGFLVALIIIVLIMTKPDVQS